MKRNIRISLLSARRVSSSYTEQIGCISSVNTRTSSVGGNHVQRLFWLPMSCMSSRKTTISSLFPSHDSSPYSIQIDSKPCETHKFLHMTHVMFEPIFRTDNVYVERQYTNFITFSESCYQALSQKGPYVNA